MKTLGTTTGKNGRLRTGIVKRATFNLYRIGISGAIACDSGKRLVIQLHGGNGGDFISLREHGRRYSVTFDVAELYRRGLIAQAAKARAERKKGRNRS